MVNTDRYTTILKHFQIESDVLSVEPFGSGHINDTYKVTCTNKNYLLQRINHSIFQDVEGLSQNMLKVTSFLKEICEKEEHMESMELIPTLENTHYLKDEKGHYWRVLTFIENSQSFDCIENVQMAYNGGKAFGWFTKVLGGLKADEIVETLPDFHNAAHRIGQFEEAVQNDIAGRLEKIKSLVEELLSRKKEMMTLYQLQQDNELPLRVTHNDTKINNLLFDRHGEAISVVDLDTIMPGLVHFDFGDAIRTFCNTAEEDEKNLSKVEMKIDYYEAFTKGFLSECSSIINQTEKKHLAFGAKYIVYEQCIRFLGDYLNGDTYYKIAYPEHNLIRAKAQYVLLHSIDNQFDRMQEIVTDYS